MLGSAREEISQSLGGKNKEACIDIYGPEGVPLCLRPVVDITD